MAGEIYANNVAKLQDHLRSLQQDQITSADQLQANLTDNYNSKMNDYVEKWKSIQDAGGEELAGVLGVKGIYQGAKKLYGVYQNLKGNSGTTAEDANDNDTADVENMGDAVDDGSVVRSTTFPMVRPSEADLEADPFQPTAGQPVSSTFVTGGTTDGGTAAGNIAGDAVADSAPEIASGLGEFFTADAVASAIPVVGEVAAGVGGLVAVGDAIYHLFHKPSDKPSAPPPPPISAPTQVTQQYASALPSVDASTQRAASSSVF